MFRNFIFNGFLGEGLRDGLDFDFFVGVSCVMQEALSAIAHFIDQVG